MNFVVKNFYFKNNSQPIIIAEAGSNHNGNIDLAKKMVDVAKSAKADIVKFQAFKSEKEISRFAPKAKYQKENTSSKESANQLELCKSLELSENNLKEIKNYCQKVKMPFLCTAFESDSLKFLVNVLKVKSIKIPSSEVTNIPFLREIGAKKIGVILSTGASSLTEVGFAVKTLQDAGCPELVLLHCVSDYPAAHDELNLNVLATLKNAFGLPVGFSDHSLGIAAPIAAATLGAVVIEKHFTLDKNAPGPDHRASVEPNELAEICKGVKIAHQALGSSLKQPSRNELKNQPLIRKSLVANKPLKKGTILSKSAIGIKRPQGGIEPMYLDIILGRKLNRDLQIDEFIKWKDLQ